MIHLEYPTPEPTRDDEETGSENSQQIIDDAFHDIGFGDTISEADNTMRSIEEEAEFVTPPPVVTTPPSDSEEISRHKFQKFAAAYFQGTASHAFSKRPLKNSLLSLATEVDRRAALAVWIAILRFMGTSIL